MQSYLAPDTINFVKITSKKPFKLVHKDTKDIPGTFSEFCLDEKFMVIDTENGEFKLSGEQLKDLLDGRYDFLI